MSNIGLDKVYDKDVDPIGKSEFVREGEGAAIDTAPAMGEGCELPLQFEIGETVVCKDGPCGQLIRVVLDPATENVTHLIVKKGRLKKQDVVVPVSAVIKTANDKVQLATTSRDLNDYPYYREVDFRVPIVGWRSDRYRPAQVVYAMSPYEGIGGQSITPTRHHHFHEGIPFNSKAVGKGTKVRNAEGHVGYVDHVLIDCNQGHITHLVIHHRSRQNYRILPVSMVLDIENDELRIAGANDDLEALPAYKR